MRVKFRNFHSSVTSVSALWQNEKCTFSATEKIFRQINYLVISLVKLAFSSRLRRPVKHLQALKKFGQRDIFGHRNIFGQRDMFGHPDTTVVKKFLLMKIFCL